MEDKFNEVKEMIINEMTHNAPIIFIDYNFEEQLLVGKWKKINRIFKIKDCQAYYNPLNPYECIFMNDFQDNISKAYHLLDLLYYNYNLGREIKKEDYIIEETDKVYTKN